MLGSSLEIVGKNKEKIIKDYESLEELKTEEDLTKCKNELNNYDEVYEEIALCYDRISKSFEDTQSTSDIMQSELYEHLINNIRKSINTDNEINTTLLFCCDIADFASDSFIDGMYL